MPARGKGPEDPPRKDMEGIPGTKTRSSPILQANGQSSFPQYILNFLSPLPDSFNENDLYVCVCVWSELRGVASLSWSYQANNWDLEGLHPLPRAQGDGIHNIKAEGGLGF